jgi:hypothetical protein
VSRVEDDRGVSGRTCGANAEDCLSSNAQAPPSVVKRSHRSASGFRWRENLPSRPYVHLRRTPDDAAAPRGAGSRPAWLVTPA